MKKKLYHYAADPEGCLTRPEKEWKVYKNQFPFLAMDSDGAWFAFSKKVSKNHYYPNEGVFKVSFHFRKIKEGPYPYLHFSHQQCIDSIYHYQKAEDNDYCPICDGYGGTLQACHGCGRPANSPCAVSLNQTKTKGKKKINDVTWLHMTKSEVDSLVAGSFSNCSSCFYSIGIRITDNTTYVNVAVQCINCDNVNYYYSNDVKVAQIHSKLFLQIKEYLDDD